VIKVALHGRMGNQLFQFAFAYLIAKKHKTFFLLEIQKNKFYLDCFQLTFPFNFFSNKKVLRMYSWLVRKIKMKNHQDFLDLKTKLVLPQNVAQINFNGYFQDADLMESNKKSLERIFAIKKYFQKVFHEKYGSLFNQNKTLVISMRLGQDYKDFILPDLNNAKVFLPNNWYTTILSKIEKEYDLVLIISDDIEEAKLILGEKLNYIFINELPEIQFQMMMNADGCIIGNSSYSWWGGFLNTKKNKKIYAPKYWAGYNAKQEYPVGIMTQEFIWV
jgi:hypothetical protein